MKSPADFIEMFKFFTSCDESQTEPEKVLWSNSDPVFGRRSGGGRAVDVPQCQVEASMHPAAAAVTRRLQGDPDQTGQQSQSCSQEEAEQRGGGSAAGGCTVQMEEVEVLESGSTLTEP